VPCGVVAVSRPSVLSQYLGEPANPEDFLHQVC
jgi:hypothetical protein